MWEDKEEEEEDAVKSESPHNNFFSLWIIWYNKLNDKLIMVQWKTKYINFKNNNKQTNKINKQKWWLWIKVKIQLVLI